MRDEKSKKWELVASNAYAAEKELQELLADSPDGAPHFSLFLKSWKSHNP